MIKKEALSKQLQQQYLHLMGIEQWVLRDVSLPESEVEVEKSGDVSGFHPKDQTIQDTAPLINPNLKAASLDWPQLQTAIQNCTVCNLSESRTRTVFGAGHPQARLMIIGAAPGEDEDKRGQPFMGKAGQLLTEMLSAIGFSREQVFITDSLKCKPLANREASQVELACCEPFLLRQIDLIKPTAILALGLVAAHNIIKTSDNIARLRGRPHQFNEQNIPVYVSYHPSYLLKCPADKSKAWQDLKQLLQILKQAQ